MLTINRERIAEMTKELGCATGFGGMQGSLMAGNTPLPTPTIEVFGTTSNIIVDRREPVERLREIRRDLVQSGGTLLNIEELQREA